MAKDTLQSFVHDSDISSEDKKFWEEAFEFINDDQAKILVDFIEDDEERLAFITENIRQKKEAFEKNDSTFLSNILEKEKSDLLL